MRRAGERAPAVNLWDGEGRAKTLEGPYTLVFFKVSCPTCQLTLPFLTRVGAEAGLVVVSQDSPEATAHFAEKFGAALPYWYDRAEEEYPASNAFGITSVPSCFVVDAAGRIEEAVEGFDKGFLEELGVVFGEAEKVPQFKPG